MTAPVHYFECVQEKKSVWIALLQIDVRNNMQTKQFTENRHTDRNCNRAIMNEQTLKHSELLFFQVNSLAKWN